MAEAESHPKRKRALAFTRRGGRSPERAQREKEAPAAQDACPRNPTRIKNCQEGAPGGVQRGPRRGRSPIRSIGLANTTGNQEQVAALPRRQRLISVPYRSAATPPKAAQRPQRGVWHQNGGAQPHNRSPLPRAGEASQTSPGGETSVPEGQKIRSIPQSPTLAPRRAGVPNFAGWRNFRARRAQSRRKAKQLTRFLPCQIAQKRSL